jgi:Flp pilus assembly pilin Flp
MVEYALLTGMVALRTIAVSVGSFVDGVNWPLVGGFAAAGAIAWWSMKPKGPYR